MNRAVRIRTRLVTVLALLLTLVASLSQPAAMLRAQEDPPPPTSTVVSDQPPATSVPSSRPGVAVVGLDQTAAPAPDAEKARQSQPAPAAPVVAPPAPASEQPAPIAPQATTLTPFLVNIVANSTARADTDLTYTIYFTNTSTTTTYQNVLLQSGIGDGQFYSSCANTTTCVYTYTGDLAQSPTLFSVSGTPQDSGGRQIVWSLHDVGPGKKGQIKYTVRVRFDYFPQSGYPSRVLGNTVALYKDGAIAQATKLNEDQWGVTIVGPVFYLTKTGTPLILLEGDRIDYTITVGNATGPTDQSRQDVLDATQVQVFDILPLPLENVQPQDGGTYDSNTRRVTWNLPGTLARGDSRQLHFSATIRNDLAECRDMNNRDFFAFNPDIPRDPGQNQYYIRGQIDTTSYIYPPATVAVTPSPPGAYVTDPVTWTVDVKNYWRTAISGVGVKFTLPPGFTYLGSSPTGTYDSVNNAVTWSNLTLPLKTDFNNPGVIHLTVQSRAGPQIGRNTGAAEILTPLPGGIPSDCLRPYFADVDIQPVLYAVKTVDRSLALPGTDVVYTIEVNNISSQTMTDVSIVDSLPAPNHGVPYQYNFVFKNVLAGTPQPTVSAATPAVPQTLSWYNLTVPAGSPGSPGKKVLRFAVTVNGWPEDCFDNLVQPDSSISKARLIGGGRVCLDYPWTVEKTVDRTSVAARDTNRRVKFTLKYISHVDTPQSFTPRDDMLDYPAFYFHYVRMVNGPDGTLKSGPLSVVPDVNGQLIWPQDTLPARGTVYYSFEADLPTDGNGVIPAGNHCNEGQFVPEPTSQYGYAIITRPPACVLVSSIDLVAYKAIDRGTVGLGELVNYNIGLENRGSQSVGSLTISDTLPVNMTYVGPATGSPAPTVTALPNGQQLLTWGGVSVPASSAKALGFKARAPSLINSNVLNMAEISGGNPAPNFICNGDPSPGDGRCLVPVNLDVRSLISIKLEPTPATIDPGGVVTYTLSLISNNNIPYQNTIVSDTLPLGFTYLDAVDSTAPSQPRPGLLVWNNQTVPPLSGPTAGKLTFMFRARAPLSYGSFRSRVDATSVTGTIPTADNTARVLIAPRSPALSLLAPYLVEPGSDVPFKISLVNPGLSPLTGVTLTDPLPNGFVYTGVDTGNLTPTVNGQTLTWSNLTVPAADSNGPGIVEITVHATAPNTLGTYTDTVTATGSQTIDQTYNSATIIVAHLTYTYVPIVLNP